MTRTWRPVIPSSGACAKRAERVGQLVVAVEGAVGDDQRDVALAARQRQRRRRSRRRRSTSRRGRASCCAPVSSSRWSWYQCVVARSGAPVLDERRRCRCARRPARSAGRCPTRAPTGSGRCRRRASAAGASVSPPGWPSSLERLWAPCRWTVSSPACAAGGGRSVARGRSARSAGGSSGPGSRRRRSTSASAGRAGPGPRPRRIGRRKFEPVITRGIGSRFR